MRIQGTGFSLRVWPLWKQQLLNQEKWCFLISFLLFKSRVPGATSYHLGLPESDQYSMTILLQWLWPCDSMLTFQGWFPNQPGFLQIPAIVDSRDIPVSMLTMFSGTKPILLTLRRRDQTKWTPNQHLSSICSSFNWITTTLLLCVCFTLNLSFLFVFIFSSTLCLL